jgi:hypothetical protein
MYYSRTCWKINSSFSDRGKKKYKRRKEGTRSSAAKEREIEKVGKKKVINGIMDTIYRLIINNALEKAPVYIYNVLTKDMSVRIPAITRRRRSVQYGLKFIIQPQLKIQNK